MSAKSLKTLGAGTAKVEEHLQELFPDHDVIRVDRDSTSRVGSWQKIYDRIQQNKPSILLGTQMLAKGHHFPHVTLVAILDIDAGLLSVDIRAPERTAQLIVQVAGRAGRGEHKGHVYLQTLRPDHPLLTTLIEKIIGQSRNKHWLSVKLHYCRLIAMPYLYALNRKIATIPCIFK